ncbi:MAG: beta-lactamase domain protein [Solirubrobacteraceae bacterium]|nr:beta-lactamase domain protein [Solirubrobacteraceae bacterium]
MFNAGWITVPAGVIRRGDAFDEIVRLPVPAYLVETATERILIDTGLHPGAAADPEAHYGQADATGPFGLELDQPVAEQIEAASLTKIVLTHLHFDHAGGLGLLPESVPIVVQRREWEAGQDRAAAARNFFLPRDYAIGDRELVLVDGDHDLLGDGSIELLLTPGHTPGHQSVRLAGGKVVLGVDVAHFATGLDDQRFPIFGDDLEEQGRSAERLRGLRDAGSRVIPGHDPDVLSPGVVALDTV